MSLGQIAYLGFVLAGFGVFILALGTVWIAERMSDRKPD